jgi:hypothetical protein
MKTLNLNEIKRNLTAEEIIQGVSKINNLNNTSAGLSVLLDPIQQAIFWNSINRLFVNDGSLTETDLVVGQLLIDFYNYITNFPIKEQKKEE